MKFEKYLSIAIVISFIALSLYSWISRYGLVWPPNFWMHMIEPENVFLAITFFIVSLTAIALCILKFNLTSSIVIVGWGFYLPVIWNITIPMFIAFMTVIGLFYSPWLPLESTQVGNLLIDGVIVFPYRPLNDLLPSIGFSLIFVGLAMYFTSLYQLLTYKIKNNKLLTKGLYSIVRHPQYLGIILWTLGVAIVGRRPINYIAWATLTYTYLVLAEFEDWNLEKKFGEVFERYAEKTSFIIPLPVRISIKNRKIKLMLYTAIYILMLIMMIYVFSSMALVYRFT